jgi:hypothetical protein
MGYFGLGRGRKTNPIKANPEASSGKVRQNALSACLKLDYFDWGGGNISMAFSI